MEVHLVYDYRPAGSFEPVFSEEGDKLVIKEEMRDSNSGSSTWTLTVPAKTKIDFSSASGDFKLSGLESWVIVRTASGDLELADASGTFTLHTASGDVKLTGLAGKIEAQSASGDCMAEHLSGEVSLHSASGDVSLDGAKGMLEVKSASGDISASGIELEGSSKFSSASGDVRVVLAKSAAFDLDVSSASGDAQLNYNGNPLQGYFEFQARASDGTIRSPVKFDREEENVRYGEKYLIKSFKKGSDTPRIRIHTASGEAALLER